MIVLASGPLDEGKFWIRQVSSKFHENVNHVLFAFVLFCN